MKILQNPDVIARFFLHQRLHQRGDPLLIKLAIDETGTEKSPKVAVSPW